MNVSKLEHNRQSTVIITNPKYGKKDIKSLCEFYTRRLNENYIYGAAMDVCYPASPDELMYWGLDADRVSTIVTFSSPIVAGKYFEKFSRDECIVQLKDIKQYDRNKLHKNIDELEKRIEHFEQEKRYVEESEDQMDELCTTQKEIAALMCRIDHLTRENVNLRTLQDFHQSSKQSEFHKHTILLMNIEQKMDISTLRSKIEAIFKGGRQKGVISSLLYPVDSSELGICTEQESRPIAVVTFSDEEAIPYLEEKVPIHHMQLKRMPKQGFGHTQVTVARSWLEKQVLKGKCEYEDAFLKRCWHNFGIKTCSVGDTIHCQGDWIQVSHFCNHIKETADLMESTESSGLLEDSEQLEKVSVRRPMNTSIERQERMVGLEEGSSNGGLSENSHESETNSTEKDMLESDVSNYAAGCEEPLPETFDGTRSKTQKDATNPSTHLTRNKLCERRYYFDNDVCKYIQGCIESTEKLCMHGVIINLRASASTDGDDLAEYIISGKDATDVEEAEAKLQKIIEECHQDNCFEVIADVHFARDGNDQLSALRKKYSNVLIEYSESRSLINLIGPKILTFHVKAEIVEWLRQAGNHEKRLADQLQNLYISDTEKQVAANYDWIEPMSFKSRNTNLKVHTLVCDITTLKVDVIVNAANGSLIHGAGVAAAIAKKGGKRLQEDCYKYTRNGRKVAVTEHYISEPGNLPCKKVMHAVGPVFDRKAKEKSLNQLKKTFENCFRKANENGFVSIALPAISSGIFGMPQAYVAMILAQCVGKVASTSKKALAEIYVVDIGPQMINLIQKQLEQEAQLVKCPKYVGRDPIFEPSTKHVTPQQRTSQPSTNTNTHRMITRSKAKASREQSKPIAKAKHSPKGKTNAKQMEKLETNLPSKGMKEEMFQSARGTRLASIGNSKVAESEEDQTCPICMDVPQSPQILPKCKHTFCKSCIDECFSKNKPVCPICGEVYGKIIGSQPTNGTMKATCDKRSLPGHDHCGMIIIQYDFPDGKQTDEHPNPGHPYKGTHRVAYLPDNKEGKKVLRLLRRAFDDRLVFTVGRSVTSGADNIVTWNDIHHKTHITGGPQRYGYPDPGYLGRVQEELAAKGITE